MRAGRISRRPDEADQLAASDDVALLDTDGEQVTVQRLQAGVVLKDDVVSITNQGPAGIAHRPGESDDPVGGGEDGRSEWHREIDSRVEMGVAGVGRLDAQ